MFHLCSVTERYCQTFDWKRLSLFKLCCICFGVASGVLVPEKCRKNVFLGSMILFLVTYIPLMVGLVLCCLQKEEELYV